MFPIHSATFMGLIALTQNKLPIANRLSIYYYHVQFWEKIIFVEIGMRCK